MKNLYKIIIPALSLSLFFASCSPTGKLSITKRHYNSGYYVDHIASVPVTAPVATAKTGEAVKNENASSVNAPATDDQTSFASKETSSAKEVMRSSSVSVKKAKASGSHAAVKAVAADEKRTLGAEPVAVEALQMFAKNPFSLRSISFMKNSKAFVDGGDSARSLIWVIILIILILWLVGLLDNSFGVGPLFNLLLLIALILFILWLLRVI